MYVIGLMSGTSVDTIDAALVNMKGQSLDLVHYRQYPFPPDIQTAIRTVDAGSSIGEVSRLDTILGHLFADTVMKIIREAGMKPEEISAVGSHGQTVLHLPDGEYPRTMQIGDPSIIAVVTGIPTIADFRRNDIAAGGQGAPLAPAFHAWRFAGSGERRVVLNLGGMANITILPVETGGEVIGFDTGPGNALMDNWIQCHRREEFDRGAHWAAGGRVHESLLKTLLSEDYFRKAPPKSTGRDEFNLAWLEGKLGKPGKNIPEVDVQRTLLELSARSISNAIRQYAGDATGVLVCGGGIHNPLLMQRLEELLTGMEISSTKKYGIDPDAVEAVAFAWLAKKRLDGAPGNLPGVTGAKKPVVLGAIYHGCSG